MKVNEGIDGERHGRGFHLTCSPVSHEYPGDDVFSDSVSLLQFCVLASSLLIVGTLVAQTSRAVQCVFGAANRPTLLCGFLG